jgi:hypothetical protein
VRRTVLAMALISLAVIVSMRRSPRRASALFQYEAAVLGETRSATTGIQSRRVGVLQSPAAVQERDR